MPVVIRLLIARRARHRAITFAAAAEQCRADIGAKWKAERWAGDKTIFPRDLIEFALAHRVGVATEEAYRRG